MTIVVKKTKLTIKFYKKVLTSAGNVWYVSITTSNMPEISSTNNDNIYIITFCSYGLSSTLILSSKQTMGLSRDEIINTKINVVYNPLDLTIFILSVNIYLKTHRESLPCFSTSLQTKVNTQ